ncbi:MAG: undecaprenyldiphospho-muramoylpentapeptide beta-N-acetylglucosaminyltransferase [Prevotella sp.]|nr:undecaprenyldiphospho-muramoylpentapeptide beta-N-acetylglucosaminyltransferase [Bacteroides sp.]MCM1366246.1 undecaprenyldiphospho-muramoylpentapeptide beta-N-acetylglucosaminyltransferase [Prevotella sp.]MCM1436349.1 undecaprenyldiphospho-muramoylpentapeptide beta-N-acetylglucosaminyltransferase [Prevotella sp.]
MEEKKYKILISGGGTGGHIFPALSIANALKRRIDCDILFVGAENRMEMEKVPAAGYKIVGLPVAGFNRKNIFKNISVLKKLFKSISMARKIVKEFKPDIAVGVGGYASGPTLKAAQRAGVPTLLQEQNSYAGVTNKLLAAKARKICTAYEGMERFFPEDKIILTGNPVRKDLLESLSDVAASRQAFGLEPDKTTILVIGGSLGARTLNQTLEAGIKRLADAGLQVIWQTGKFFGNRASEAAKGLKGVVVTEFIADMAKAYSAASFVVSRAGAGSISELELLGKASILVPSPNVAEDHQTKNAQALEKKGAAILVHDRNAPLQLIEIILGLAANPGKIEAMASAAKKMALPDSDEIIVDQILNIINNDNATI